MICVEGTPWDMCNDPNCYECGSPHVKPPIPKVIPKKSYEELIAICLEAIAKSKESWKKPEV